MPLSLALGAWDVARHRRSHQQNAASAYNSLMYIVAIGWLYVTVLMALTEASVTAGILTLLFYGLLPLALLLWLCGGPARRRRSGRKDVESTADAAAEEPDR